MEKKIIYLLIFILTLGLIGCSNTSSLESKQYSSSSLELKQEYLTSFSPSFASDAVSATKICIDLYNNASDDDSFQTKMSQELNNFKEIGPNNANERDFQDSIKSFSTNYAFLSLHNSLLKAEQTLRDSGAQSKSEYDEFMTEFKEKKSIGLKDIKQDLDTIMKYYK